MNSRVKAIYIGMINEYWFLDRRNFMTYREILDENSNVMGLEMRKELTLEGPSGLHYARAILEEELIGNG
jgi:hypothetical protein